MAFPVAAPKKQRTKILPNKITGKVLEWKGKHGWIQPDQPISHPQAQLHRGKVFLSQGDVEAEIDGIGARVSFFVYADGTGLGAMNCRPAGAEVVKTVIKPLQQTQQQVSGLRPAGMMRAQATAPQPVAPRPRPVVPPGKTMGGVAGLRPGLVPATHGTMATTNHAQGGKGAVPPVRPAPVRPAALGKKAPGPRRRVGEDAVTGTVKAWKGAFGWITPDEPIQHPLFKGQVYISQSDCEDKETMAEGLQVAFYLYTDSQGLGAECCAMGVEPAAGMTRSPEGAAGASSGAAGNATAVPARVGPKAVGPVAAGVLPVLKPGGQTVVQPGLKGMKRQRITELEVMGEVTEWKGSFGWITPQDPIEHEQASKNEGKVKVLPKDITGDEKKLAEGQLVQFHVFFDAAGLGAEECLPF